MNAVKDVNQPETTYLSFLVDDGNSVLQLHIVEEAGKEDIGNTNQTVVFLLIKERVRATEVRSHHLENT